MTLFRLQIEVRSAFATPPKGDTLFGQLCWQIAETEGTKRLEELLAGYTEGRPFAVVGDMLPEDMLLFPPVPLSHLGIAFDPKKRKEIKRRRAFSMEQLQQNGGRMDAALKDSCISAESSQWAETIQMRNSIDRIGGTTGEGFDPFASMRSDLRTGEATLYLLIDEERIERQIIEKAFQTMGTAGFGKDATVGRGRFNVVSCKPFAFTANEPNALLTLAPSVLADQGFEEAYYEPFTRFGKHGGHLAHGLPWKNPVLMADTFALIHSVAPRPFIGMGLGGDGSISARLPQTVHQGYAPTVSVRLEGKE